MLGVDRLYMINEIRQKLLAFEKILEQNPNWCNKVVLLQRKHILYRHFFRECGFKGNQNSRRRDAWNTGNKDKENGRRSGKQEDSKALVTLDGEGVDWTSHSEDE
ncbi:ribonuclease H-like domain-containing protein [Tanacetum coccineum]